MPWAIPGYLAAVAVGALVLGYGASPSGADLRSITVGRKATVVGYRAGVERHEIGPGRSVQLDAGDERAPLDGTGEARPLRARWDGRRNARRGPSERGRASVSGGARPVEAVRGGNRLGGWIASPTREPNSPNLVVVDAGGRMAGLGLVGFHRTDVGRADIRDADWTGFIAYVRGEPTGPLRIVLLGEDGRTALCGVTQTSGSA